MKLSIGTLMELWEKIPIACSYGKRFPYPAAMGKGDSGSRDDSVLQDPLKFLDYRDSDVETIIRSFSIRGSDLVTIIRSFPMETHLQT